MCATGESERCGMCSEGEMLQETEACPRYYYIDRRQSVTTDFRQHCIRVKHYLYSINSIQDEPFQISPLTLELSGNSFKDVTGE